ncbi:Rieske 2Fe-2S domain-containing protein [Streptomyces sp. NPDC050263]|uniref:Rieske 2Fe-2S domain-containing protein n=1 Tax=Streptomyces sp. NPDC050263 TaxID=3155037 RepID=UPI003438A16E
MRRGHTRALTEGPSPADAHEPVLPYPDGWFSVAFSSEVVRGALLTRPLQGEDVVLYRLRDGEVRAVRPYCPHLGAHLGLGALEGDALLCPFHRFAFGPDGACTRTGYGTPPPPSSDLTLLPVREVDGAVFVWRHHDGRAPDWELTPWHTLGTRAPRLAAWEMAGHSQDVVENTVDIGHFTPLHGWGASEVAEPAVFEGRSFRISVRSEERVPLLGASPLEVTLEGNGISRVHVCTALPRFGVRTCAVYTTTMIAPAAFQLRQTSRFEVAEPAALPAPLARWVSGSVHRLLAGVMFRGNCAFVSQDFPVWATKRYVSPPRLARGDGPIGPFRHWARQFYPPDRLRARVPSSVMRGAAGEAESRVT